MERQTYTVAEAAGILGISRNSAYSGIKLGEIPSIRVGRRILVPRDGLEEVLGARSQVAPPEERESSLPGLISAGQRIWKRRRQNIDSGGIRKAG